jgi:GNAT superfamily N-acetyltransferase
MLHLRFATKEDIPAIKRFIIELAEYEHLSDQVVAREEDIKFALFTEKSAHALIAEVNGEPVGHAIFFYNFSTFLCKKGLFIEDIYITPQMRGQGFGKQIFKALARIAEEQGCGRMEWNCLAWNEPSIKFYENMGAHLMSDWRVFRLDAPALKHLAE